MDWQWAAYITHRTGKCIYAIRVTFRVEELQDSEDYKRFGNCVCRLNCKQSQTRIFNPHTDVNRLIDSLKTLSHFMPIAAVWLFTLCTCNNLGKVSHCHYSLYVRICINQKIKVVSLPHRCRRRPWSHTCRSRSGKADPVAASGPTG